MELREGTAMLRSPKRSGAVLVKNLYLSCDPYMRGRMRENYDSYIPPFQPGSVIEGFGVSKVVDSDNPSFGVGDLVSGLTGWEEYSLISKTERLRKIQIKDIPLSYHVGLLGRSIAYAIEQCSLNQFFGTGAVGQLVGQLARLHGCYVVGSAGTRQKVDLLKNKLGFDEAFNYKEESDLNIALKRYFPKGIDIYFDNVGGPMLDAVLLNMRLRGRIAVCGMVSQSGVSDPQGICNLLCLVTKSVRMQGFLQHDHLHLFPQFLDHMVSYYKQGKIVYIEDMSEGLESAPNSFVGLFTGTAGTWRAIMLVHHLRSADVPGFLLFMTMESMAIVILLQTLLWSLQGNICHGTETDIKCLRTLRQSLKDPNDMLKYSWKFDNLTEGFICKFNGVDCWHPDESRVLNLRLSNMGLQGRFPSGLEYCKSLTGLDLSNNNFAGSIPHNISNMLPYVTSLDLSFNSFWGEIPVSLSNCTYLNVLNLQHNRLTGQIPGQIGGLDRLTAFNVADNLLSGPIPYFKKSFQAIYFANNQGLCGKPLENCKGSPKKSHTTVIVGAAIGGALFTIVVVGVILFYCLRNVPIKKREKDADDDKWVKSIKGAKGVKAS
ncbi:putative 2-alkenal reductase (NADP(+)-dependent) [Cocos nucifera]|uniref:Putative 2-alkenal reductase (NADP(+)-dependent) n=1 Tax=Cocos nucifera TaxID=13894 RepID=A0A8K0HX61_COCNU|nr:putative 2-alkenal reductase (NADP(+)-dependent) [Cocos nucifera]